MKIHYKLFLFLTIGSFFTFAGCQDDEVVDLVTYPVNQPTMTIDDTEGASKATLTAVYKSDGTLQLDGPVSRTYTFHFAASPEEATVTFDVMATNIPKENLEISNTKVVLPAGSTDASVTVALKDEDFGFAVSNYEVATYELAVKASVEGYKIGNDPIESKVVIEKEAYTASCSIVGKNGNKATFERAYSQGNIVNTEPIAYTFKMKLDKPARKDVKVKLSTTGLDEKFASNITVTPAEIIIPAGAVESGEAIWSVTDDFLLTTAEPETYNLIVNASVESEDPVVIANEKENILTFRIDKVLRNIGYVSDKGTDWINQDKSGWSVQLSSDFRGNGANIIDGKGGKSGDDIYTRKTTPAPWIIVDMKSERVISGLGIDYYENSSSASSPRKVTIFTSLDKETWVGQGTVNVPQSYEHNFQIFTPVNTRYVKIEFSGRYNNYIDLTEIYVYGAQ